MKKALKIICPILIILILIAAFFIHRYTTRIRFNTDYVNGNTQGNLYNEGTFCEYNGMIYFANPDDKNTLYSMDSYGKNLKKLCNDTVYFINVDDHYIYYVRKNVATDTDYFFFSNGNNSLCRLPRKGGEATVVDDQPCMYASLCGNYIYYLRNDKNSATSLYRIKIDGTEKTQISKTPTLTCGANGQYIYYSGKESDGNLYELNTATNQSTVLLNCNSYNPIVSNKSDIYYLDVAKDNRLVHTGVEAAKPTVLSDKSIDHYNVYGSTIFYQTYEKDGSGLYMIKNDGSNETLITLGTYHRIQITSQYIYFTEFFTGQVYYTSTTNPGLIDSFHPGKK